ncbi:MAG: lysoplasmalogenase [Sphingopyxis sp.]|nr:lysoplasmalogenase [Sphingopyxis sp.]
MGERSWDRARWLWWLALAGGISFFVAVFQHWEGPAIIAWKGSGVTLLALWAAANARGLYGWLITLVLALGALGDVLLETSGMIPGAVAFLAGHVVAIFIYLRHYRPKSSISQRLLVALTVPASVLIACSLMPASERIGIATYTLFVSAMAASAWGSQFSRYRVGIGAMMFLASDLFIFAGEGGSLSRDVTMWLIWPLYFAGQALIAWGVVGSLSVTARGAQAAA